MRQRNPDPVFVPQFESAEDVERRIANRENEDMNAPEWNWCGICCVRMVLLGLGRDAPTREQMYRTAFDEYGAFKTVDGSVLGAYHRELATFVEQEYGLGARAARNLSADDLARLVDEGRYAIVSVSASIRTPDSGPPERRSGHLVLVYRVEETEAGRVFVLHNSAGFESLGSQTAVRVPEARFVECFSGNAILISCDQG